MKLWLTTDGGLNFTQIGDANAAWGAGNPFSFSTLRGSFDGSSGVLLAVSDGATTDDVWRYDASAVSPAWVDGGTDTKWRSVIQTPAPSIGDGVELVLWRSAGSPLLTRTYFPFSTAPSTWSQQGLVTQLPPLTNSFMGTAMYPPGFALQVATAGRIIDYTFTVPFQAGVTLVAPPSGGSIPSNVGSEGVPTTFQWDPVPEAACYDVQFSLTPDFITPALDPTGIPGACPVANGVTTAASLTVGSAYFALLAGQTYFWRVRVRATDASLAGLPPGSPVSLNPGPWSPGRSFSVVEKKASSILLSPTSGAAGSSVSVSSTTFGGGETGITLYFDSTSNPPLIPPFAADVTGAFAKSITIPAGASAGAHLILAVGPVNNAAAPFEVTVSPPPPPPSPFAGFHAHYACRQPQAGDLRDLGIDVPASLAPDCPAGWQPLQLLVKH